MASLPHVCLPINLDAFVLNEAVCNSGGARMAPITQPNYISLRMNNSQIQHDILPHVDLHNSRPALANPRIASTFSAPFERLDPDNPISDPTTLASVNRSRLGVYLHWTIPRAYRSATSQAANPTHANVSQSSDPHSTSKYLDNPNPNPEFPRVPNRWLLVRTLRDFGLDPRNSTIKPDLVSAWVIESDKLLKIDELDASIDLETDVSPFVAFSTDASNVEILNNQAENYVGQKIPLAQWSEKTTPGVDGNDRVPLTVMNSSNPLFADYAIHNPNVFSTKDNFQYGPGSDPLFLQHATCDYVVVGWHADTKWDPLGTVKNPDAPVDLRSRLERLLCLAPAILDDADDKSTNGDKTRSLNKSIDTTRLVCHSARYSVVFNKDKPRTPADEYAANFNDKVDMEPVAVGTTALDAILAFFKAHEEGDDEFENSLFEDETASAPPAGTDTTTVRTAHTLMKLRELLYATEDDYDSRIKAADLIFTHNFARTVGGFSWHFNKAKASNEPPMIPVPGESEAMHQLNEYQNRYDAAARQFALIQWALFSEFFKYVSDPSNQDPDRLKLYSSRVPNLRAEATNLNKLQTDLQAKVDTQVKIITDMVAARAAKEKAAKAAEAATASGVSPAELPPSNEPEASIATVKKVANNAFFRRTDPTLVLAGLDAGWDDGFLNKNTPTRFTYQLSHAKDVKLSEVLSSTLQMIMERLPKDFSATVRLLIQEASGGFPDSLGQLGHKKWTRQPFSPQFVEWEGVYYHINGVQGIDKQLGVTKQWDVQLANSALSSSNHKQITYVNPNNLSSLHGQDDPRGDTRHISGRMLILPQPSFALDAVVAQVLGATPTADLPEELQSKDRQTEFKTAIKKLKFVSGQLTGLTEALLTQATGSHVKPNVRPQGQDFRPLQAAVEAGSKIGLTNLSDFALMGGETARTPYGTLTDFTAVNQRPFKPVQHGQFAITKLTIVDKFGQAIAVPAPAQTADLRTRKLKPDQAQPTPNFIHPCLSEQLIPSLLSDNTLNTVYTPQETHDHATKSGYPLTPFIQLTPAINQEARINVNFVEPVYAKDSINQEGWSICSDWESPIFGWILVDYSDSALQFFTGSGYFYTAVSFGGPRGVIEAPHFAPFEKPSTAEALASPQLIDLVGKLIAPGGAGKEYFVAIWDMIRRATPTMPYPPSEYAQFANAIVGKPLALVNVGWSLELAQPPLWPQHTLGIDIGPVALGEMDPLRRKAAEELTSYAFKVKIGDAERPFDGMVAYWNANDKDENNKSRYDPIHTYFPETDSTKKDRYRKDITPDNYPFLHPYFLDPSDFPNDKQFTKATIDQLMIKTVLMDPYTPIHLYSAILPIISISLPAWTLQDAMKNMTAFVTMGPLLLTKDVPKRYDPTHPLRPDSWLAAQSNPATTAAAPSIRLPIAGGKGMWNWLQPYSLPHTASLPPSAGAAPVGPVIADDGTVLLTDPNLKTNETHYNALEVGNEDGTMRADPAPYTFVEGFLQLARPLVSMPAPTPG